MSGPKEIVSERGNEQVPDVTRDVVTKGFAKYGGNNGEVGGKKMGVG